MNEATVTNSPGRGRKLYEQRRLVFMTIDPVHIGAGGYRLGRVDNTITREPGTNLPKIPGTSLMGAAKSYAAMRYNKPAAAGQQKNLSDEQKKSKLCPIIYTFGTATESEGGQAGSVSIGDAHLLFFPVYSMAGPLWVSTKEKVIEASGKESIDQLPVEPDDKGQTVTSLDWKDNLNLGWLLLPTKSGLIINAPDEIKESQEWQAIADRIVLVSPKVFSQIVNSNLEVRTSVSIDPETGAAEGGALFTYEAIPRAAWLWCDAVQDNYRELNGKSKDPDQKNTFPVEKQYLRKKDGEGQENAGDEFGNSEIWKSPMDVLLAGCRLIEHLGIGGMGTRGFGRMRLLSDYPFNNGGAK
ncbi:MAG: type III-B CRISPR module RAMP protein Cmr4 [Blastocatellia bacterium]|nr:type III-B CRISPR module RAMP protein Cmr4 [Blastocatellia bacterium]